MQKVFFLSSSSALYFMHFVNDYVAIYILVIVLPNSCLIIQFLKKN